MSDSEESLEYDTNEEVFQSDSEESLEQDGTDSYEVSNKELLHMCSGLSDKHILSNELRLTEKKIEALENVKMQSDSNVRQNMINSINNHHKDDLIRLQKAARMDKGLLNYLYDWAAANGGIIGGSTALAAELTRQNKGAYIGWIPNDIDIYFKTEEGVHFDPRNWKELDFQKKYKTAIVESFKANFVRFLQAYNDGGQTSVKGKGFKDSLHESYGLHNTSTLNGSRETPEEKIDKEKIDMTIQVFNYSPNYSNRYEIWEISEDYNPKNIHKVPGDLYCCYPARTLAMPAGRFPQPTHTRPLKVKKGDFVYFDYWRDGGITEKKLYINGQKMIERNIRRMIGMAEEEVERNQVIGPNHEFYDRYIAAKTDITNLRIEANNAAIEAAKQTNTVLPKPDKSKFNDGYGYVNMRAGPHDTNYGIVPCNIVQKKTVFPSLKVQLIFLYGNVSIPRYIDLYYDFSISKVFIDTKTDSLTKLHPDVVDSRSLDKPQNEKYSTLGGVVNTVTRRWLKYISRGFIPIQIRNRISSIKRREVNKGWTQHLDQKILNAEIISGFNEFIDDLKYYFLQKIVDIQNGTLPLQNRAFIYRYYMHGSIKKALEYHWDDGKKKYIIKLGDHDTTYRKKWHYTSGKLPQLDTPFFPDFMKNIIQILNDMNINSDDFSNSSTSTFINNQLDTEINNIIIEFYNEIDVIFALYNRIPRNSKYGFFTEGSINGTGETLLTYRNRRRINNGLQEVDEIDNVEDMQNIANDWRNGETPIRFDTEEEGQEVSRSDVEDWEQERYIDSSIRNATTVRSIEDEKKIAELEQELNSRKLGLVQSVIDNSFDDSYIDVGGVRRNMEQNEDLQRAISQFYGGKSKSNKLLRYVYSN
tara:strand:- start:354 stop:2960 length:2607 start_codon:yes stop_codon:yes gene_type:complete